MAEYDNVPLNTDDDDIREDDLEFNPRLEPLSSKAWLNLLEESEKAFEDWNDHCDKIDKQYANLQRLSNNARDKEFQMFWANVEVLKPSIYAKKPDPVVVTKFKDRRPVPQAAAELLERAATVSFDIAYINDLMLQIRDDVAITGRGVAWARYESKRGSGYYGYEKVCFDHKDRKDFLHGIARCWYEVPWVAAASYLTREEARERFYEHSGDAYKDADYEVNKDAEELGGADNRQRAKFWEVWHKHDERCVWVAKGCDKILDESEPEIEFQNFFPCPQPAYGTCQRGSLVPVPDVLQYKDQLEELNMLTGRIHALSDALEAKGFYPAGGAELADAIQAAVQTKTSGRLLVPISNWAAFGGSKEVIIWLPIDMISATITQLVALRRQIIEDIYQIIGLSDIMRGATDPAETLGAQQMKQQYGSSRIRDKQESLVRFSRDLVQLTADIICEKFDPVTVIEMTQTDIPTQRMVTTQVAQLQQQLGNQQFGIQKAQQMPQFQQMAQQDPEQMQGMMGQAQTLMQSGQDAIKKLMARPTFEQVWRFLKDNRARAFVLDIETDSTILVDENAEKQRRAEFVGVLAQLLPQLAQMIMADPGTADFCGEVLKFATAPYRAGRSMDAAINELIEMMKQKGQQQKGDDPQTAQTKAFERIENQKAQINKQKVDNDHQIELLKLTQKEEHDRMQLAHDARMKMVDVRGDQQDTQDKAQQSQIKIAEGRQKAQTQQIVANQKMRESQQKLELAREQGRIKMDQMRQMHALKTQQAQQNVVFRQQEAVQRQQANAQREQERQAAAVIKQQQGPMQPSPGGRPI